MMLEYSSIQRESAGHCLTAFAFVWYDMATMNQRAIISLVLALPLRAADG
jgi:hypothetical protein